MEQVQHGCRHTSREHAKDAFELYYLVESCEGSRNALHSHVLSAFLLPAVEMVGSFLKSVLSRSQQHDPQRQPVDDMSVQSGEEPDPETDAKKDEPKILSVEVGEEKVIPGARGVDSEEDSLSDDDPTMKDLPWSVRRVVSLTDDPTEPTLTFRYFILTVLFVVPGAFLSQLSHYRTTSAAYSVFFVQIASNYVGIWLAKVLPAKQVRIPFTSYGFNLNPGPWSTKEHVLVTISAASGATYNLAYAPVSIAELYFDKPFNPGVAIVFMWAVVVTGYSFAAISRQFLLYDPQYPWFQASVSKHISILAH